MALLALQNGNGTVNLAAAAGGGDTVARKSTGFLLVRNPTGGSITLTLVTPGKTHGLDIQDKDYVVAAGAFAVVPIHDEVFENPSDNLIHITYSGAGLTLAAVVL